MENTYTVRVEDKRINEGKDLAVALKLGMDGVIRFDETGKVSQGRTEYLISSEKNGGKTDLGNFSYPETLEGFLTDCFAKQGFEVAPEPYRKGGFDLRYSRLDDEVIEMTERLQTLQGAKNKLGFWGFTSFADGEIEVEYSGHEVSGSFVHAHEVAPGYVEDLERETNRRVAWSGKRSGGFGFDIYKFTVKLGKKLERDFVYKPKYALIEKGKVYLATEDFPIGPDWEIGKGAVFRVSHKGSGWTDCTRLEILSGNARTIHSPSRWSLPYYEGHGRFMDFKEIAKKLEAHGVENPEISYDPYKGEKFPAEAVAEDTA